MDYNEEDPLGYEPKADHTLGLGDICTVQKGKHAGKTVLIIKAGIQTKYGLRAITVEWHDNGDADAEKVWCAPDELVYINRTDIPTAEKIKEADYQEWKSRQAAGVPPKSDFNKKGKGNYYRKDNRPTDTGF